MPPSFIQRPHHAQAAIDPDRVDSGNPAQGPTKRNPFVEVANELAIKWDQIVGEMNSLRDKAERHRAENIRLSGQLEAARQELTDRVSLLSSELKRQTERSDIYQTAALKLRVKFELMAETLIATLKQDFPDKSPPIGAPEKREARDTQIEKPRRDADVPEEDVAEIIELINRLTPSIAPDDHPLVGERRSKYERESLRSSQIPGL
jgi:hypothetical protein